MELVIKIDKDICTGCRECSNVCPMDAIKGEKGAAQEIDESKCVMCGQCVQKCKSYVSLVEHGKETYRIKKAERNLPDSLTEPLFAAYNVSNIQRVKDALLDKNVYTMVQSAPAVRVGIAEDFGNELGTLAAGKLAAALKKLGFDRVYDTNFPADLTIMEEGTELIRRVTEGGKLPMFTSCCPAWVRFLELNYPEFKDNLSTCKSPQQMGGAIFKTYAAQIDNVDPKDVFSVSIMPCTCKAFECDRPEMADSGYRDVDVVLTTRELAYLIKDMGIDFNGLKDEKFDEPLGVYTGAGEIFGVTGGVMEAALRTGYELITKTTIPDIDIKAVRGTDGFRKTEIQIGDLRLKVGIVTGLKHAWEVLYDIKAGKLQLDFIEVMSCPQGCISGGGQPKLLLDEESSRAYEARTASTYEHDRNLEIRKSHENPAIKKLYKEFLKEPLSEKSHNLLHTEYCN